MIKSNKIYSISDRKVPYEIPTDFKEGLMFVAECSGQEEDKGGHPLIGKAGDKFNDRLDQVSIHRDKCIIANTFKFRPEENKIDNYFISAKLAKEQDIEVSAAWPKHNSKSLIKHFEPELHDLYNTITKYKPKVVVPMGEIAMWATIKQAGITQAHGIPVEHIFKSKTRVHECWVVPIFHPASVFPNRRPENEPLVLEALKIVKEKVKQ